MSKKIVIVGAGGHGKVVADIALKNGYKDIYFVDDNAVGECFVYPIIGTSEILERLNDGKTDFVIAVGNNEIRKKIAESHDVNWVTLIHPSAQIGANAKIGIGTVVMAGAVINACASIGNHCIINTCAVVEHDNVVDDYVHISPNVALGGTVHIGKCTHIGIGATVINNINICGDCRIGAGAVVVKDIFAGGGYTSAYLRTSKHSKKQAVYATERIVA